MSFGSRLKDRRERLKLTQAELGKKLNVTGAAIGNYENGVSFPNADILYKVFDALECDANYLFQDEMNHPEMFNQSRLLNFFIQLNEEGQDLVVRYAGDLVSSGNYIKNSSSGMVQN